MTSHPSAPAADSRPTDLEHASVGAARARVSSDVGKRYEIGAVLGSGLGSTVWSCVDLATSQPVAIKQIRAEGGGGSQFFREIGVLFQLQHPRIVKLLNLVEGHATAQGHERGACYLVLELCHGGSLRELGATLRSSDLSPSTRRRMIAGILRDVALGLRAAHRTGWLHRDLKPDNILLEERADLSSEGVLRAKIVDFGLAQCDRPRYSEKSGTAGPLRGTPQYMAPEVFGGHSTPASDWYSLGAVAFELLHGRPLFSGSNTELARHHLNTKPSFDDQLPASWRTLLTDLLAKSPENRRFGPDRVEEALAGLADSEAAQITSATRPTSSIRFDGNLRLLATPSGDDVWLVGPHGLVDLRLDGQGNLSKSVTHPWTQPLGIERSHIHSVLGPLVTAGETIHQLRTAGDWELVHTHSQPIQELVSLGPSNEGIAIATRDQILGSPDARSTNGTLAFQWKRPLAATGLATHLAPLPTGRLAYSEGPRHPRLVIVDSAGCMDQTIRLPGIVWRLEPWEQEAPGEFLLALLLHGESLIAHCIDVENGSDTELICIPVADAAGISPRPDGSLFVQQSDGRVQGWHPATGLCDVQRLELHQQHLGSASSATLWRSRSLITQTTGSPDNPQTTLSVFDSTMDLSTPNQPEANA